MLHAYYLIIVLFFKFKIVCFFLYKNFSCGRYLLKNLLHLHIYLCVCMHSRYSVHVETRR